MEPNAYHELMMGLISNSPFLAWMVYSYIQQQKDLRETRAENKEEVRLLRTEQKKEETEIRGRFEQVIQQLNKDRTQLIESFSGRIDSLERGQERLLQLLEPIQNKLHEIEIERKIKQQTKVS